jgi:hypothetical protein
MTVTPPVGTPLLATGRRHPIAFCIVGFIDGLTDKAIFSDDGDCAMEQVLIEVKCRVGRQWVAPPLYHQIQCGA